MRQIRIPDRHRPALQALADATLKSARDAARALEGLGPLSDQATLAKTISKILGDGSESEAANVVDALIGLHSLLAYREWPIEEVASSVSVAEELQLTGKKRKRLAQILEILLAVPVIENTAKATDIATERERVFAGSRVLTDVRPIFERDPNQPPGGAVITQTLRIDFFAEGEEHSLFVAMDDRDLRDLSSTLERAIDKTDSLRDFLGERDLAVAPFYVEES